MSSAGLAPSLKLLHTSDVHIGGRPARDGVPHGEVCICSLLAVLELARHTDCDGVLLVGDIFDHNRLPDSYIEAAAEAMAASGLPCVILPGNHDHLGEGTTYDRVDMTALAPNVLVLDDPEGMTVNMFDGKLSVWGRPTVVHEPAFRPMANVPLRPDANWFVAMAHGHYTLPSEENRSIRRASPISLKEIEVSGTDYVALGHWDQPTEIGDGHPLAWYSGCPAGEWGEGNAIVLSLSDVDPAVELIHVHLPADGCAEYDFVGASKAS